ncbi:hypothetical protein B0H19DRAFT_1083970 [Mycena capillaripes]|nr:hypothetical protein B0H19DRAFT_1083970 [Mycena capillaripes]
MSEKDSSGFSIGRPPKLDPYSVRMLPFDEGIVRRFKIWPGCCFVLESDRATIFDAPGFLPRPLLNIRSGPGLDEDCVDPTVPLHLKRDDAKHCGPSKKWVGYGARGNKNQGANWEEHVQRKKHKESSDEEDIFCADPHCNETGDLEMVACAGPACGSKFHLCCIDLLKAPVFIGFAMTNAAQMQVAGFARNSAHSQNVEVTESTDGRYGYGPVRETLEGLAATGRIRDGLTPSTGHPYPSVYGSNGLHTPANSESPNSRWCVPMSLVSGEQPYNQV